jgi:hypothetical protein
VLLVFIALRNPSPRPGLNPRTSGLMASMVTITSPRRLTRAVSRRLLTTETRVHYQDSLCGICGGQSGNVTGLSLSLSVFACQYHSTAAPYSLMYHLVDRQRPPFRRNTVSLYRNNKRIPTTGLRTRSCDIKFHSVFKTTASLGTGKSLHYSSDSLNVSDNGAL